MSDASSETRFVHDAAGGGILMRCPICHRSRYISEFTVFVRKEPQHCPACSDPSAMLELVRRDDQESAATRLRSRRQDIRGDGG